MSDVQLFLFDTSGAYLGSPPPKGSFFLASKRNKKCRLKIFLLKAVVRLEQCSPKNLLGRV